MALLKLDVLTFSAQVEATDENAIRILQAMLKRHGYDVDILTGIAGNGYSKNYH